MPTIPWEQVREIVDAVLDRPAAERAVFLDSACPESSVRRYVESLVSSYEQAGEILEVPAMARYPQTVVEGLPDSWLGRRLGAYELMEEIGHGGMGSVYRAARADDQFRKQVAIKLVRGGFDGLFVRERFLAERQILSDLDHPNIARLLDGGSTEDGQPYFVMEYIEGLPLDRYCDDRNLTVSARLELFLTVCSAVQYAHQKLVIHRDIKPGNILVTPDGSPKLLDFGIAKIITPEVGAAAGVAARTVVRMLTPEYASPEQRRGEMISTASDTYSLGVVLYELLTGRHPYHLAGQTPEAMDRTVETSEPERPSDAIDRPEADAGHTSQPSPEAVSATREGSPEKLRRRLKGDLDTILLKALRKERERRYASVEQFSEDIRRHLEGLPVLARKDTLAYRTGKFATRHATAVIAAALVLLSLAVGLVIALHEARVARDQRTRAEERFNDVRDLANSLLFPVYDAIEDIPGSTAARKLLVDKALHYLDSLSREAQDDSTLQRELAAAYERIGDVQGNSLSANLGDSAGALASAQKALAIRTTLYQANPSRLDDAVSYARALRLTAKALSLNGKTAAGSKLSRQASETAESALRAHPRDVQLLTELSQDYSTLAAILGGDYGIASLGNSNDALPVREKNVDVEERLLSLDPQNPDRQRSYAVSLAHMGDQFVLVGQRREALPYFTRSEAMFRTLAGTSPGRKTLEALQGIYTRLSVTQQGVGNNQAALDYANKALDVARRLSQADPHDIHAQISLIIDYDDVASVRLAMTQLPQALAASNQAVSSVDKLVAANRDDGELPSIQAGVYESAGDILSRLGDYRNSLIYFRNGIQILTRTRSQDPENVDAALDLAGAYNEFAKSLVRAHAFDKAIEIFRKAASLSEPVANGNRPNEISQYALAESYGGMGYASASLAATIHEASHRIVILKQAKSWYEQSLDSWAKIKEPGALTPDGYNCVSPTVVKQRLASVNSALGQLGKAAHLSREDEP